ncbi:hypothetical protein JV173_06090 [Acholeplasma equirhinis]|uniref:hypothetical protein n=1 Tax=Acholeplasma equirhinis TaxID=555393 RepID=UPI00197AAD98|nr:hypothetical protein [Acholeplasma equirhinis]MBN3491086.1 hypothetical protein [Acholeplasma equirhinis]
MSFTLVFLAVFFIFRYHPDRELILVITVALSTLISIPVIMISKIPLYKAFNLLHTGKFIELLEYAKKHQTLVLTIDSENMKLLVAVAAFTLYDDLTLMQYMKEVKHKKLLGIKYATMSMYYGVIGMQPESLDYYVKYKEHIKFLKPYQTRVRFMKYMEKFHLIVEGHASQSVFEDLEYDLSNPRVTEFIRKFKNNKM